MATLYLGDCIDVMARLEADSVDACVTDPPYNLEFMGKAWDSFKSPMEFQAWCERWGRELFRVLKPGAHALVFGGTRTYHRMASGIEDAGFEVRDFIDWIYGSGFPKSLNLGEGLGTALKPAHEPILLARKPFRGSVKANVETHGTGALNIDACRISTSDSLGGGDERAERTGRQGHEGWDRPWKHDEEATSRHAEKVRSNVQKAEALGRWPANVVIDDVAALVLDEQSGELVSGANPTRRRADKFRDVYGAFAGQDECNAPRGTDIGGASRFFYCAKPSRAERDMGTEDLVARPRDDGRKAGNPGGDNPRNRGVQARGNFHPTVKPVDLIRWLVRLVTPPGGTVIDPFFGSGTTGMAARYELRECIGIDNDADYLELAQHRIAACMPLFDEGEDGPAVPVQAAELQTMGLFDAIPSSDGGGL